jgi:hypothetical protein
MFHHPVQARDVIEDLPITDLVPAVQEQGEKEERIHQEAHEGHKGAGN